MSDPETELTPSIDVRRLTRLYIFALSLVALLSCCGHFVVHRVLMNLEGDAGVINLAGRQRMLSQRIPRIMLTLQQIDDENERRARIAELDQLLRQWTTTHHKLAGLSGLLSDQRANSTLVQDLFRQIKPDFEAVKQSASNLIALPESELPAIDPTEVRAMVKHSDAFLLGMDKIVFQYEDEARARVERLQRLEWGLLAATLIVLVCEGLFIFGPAASLLRRSFSQLQYLAQQLSSAKNFAETANSAKTNFLTRVSHELRTPLHALLGMLSLVRQSPLDSKQKQRVQLSVDAAKSLQGLVDDLLDIARIESNSPPKLHCRNVNISRLLRRSIALMQPMAKKKGLTLELSIADDLPSQIWSDPIRLRQVIDNLLQNAIRYTDVGGVLCEAMLDPASSDGTHREQWLLRIIDSGRGIQPEDQDRIFESFVRVGETKNSTSSFGEGLGLGLPITASLVQAMGGKIQLQSRPDRGTTVEVALPTEAPVDRSDSNVVLVEPRKPIVRHTRQKPKALIVDDSQTNQELMRAYLRRLGYRTRSSDSVEIAFEACQKHRPELVVLDKHLRSNDGVDLAIRIHQCIENYTPTILLVTADIYLRQESLDPVSRIQQVLYKPLSFQSLARALELPAIGSPGQDPYVELRKHLQDTIRRQSSHDIEVLRRTLQESRWNELQLEAHRLRGAAANAGLAECADAALRLEESAKSELREQCEADLRFVSETLQRLNTKNKTGAAGAGSIGIFSVE